LRIGLLIAGARANHQSNPQSPDLQCLNKSSFPQSFNLQFAIAAAIDRRDASARRFALTF
jgi:hypothetical protein